MKGVRGVYGCSLWRSVRAAWDRFVEVVKYDVGDVKCEVFTQ